MAAEIIFSPVSRPGSLEVNFSRSLATDADQSAEANAMPQPAHGSRPVTGVLFSPVERPDSFQVLVPDTAPTDPGQPTDNGERLRAQLRHTRQLILELREAFKGLHAPPRPDHASARDPAGLGAPRPTAEPDLFTRLAGAREDRGAESEPPTHSFDHLI